MKEFVTEQEAKEEYKKLTDVENKTGFLYFCENYVKVSHPSRGVVSWNTEMYQWQKHAAIGFLSSRYIISRKTRQVGFSTLVAAYSIWRSLFFDSQRSSVVSIGQRESTEFLSRMKFIYDQLPGWLKQETSEWKETSFKFAHNDSRVMSLPNKGDPARGSSLSLLVADEFAMYSDQESVLAAATPALSAGALTPFSNKSLPSQFFIISTLPHKNVVDNEYLRILHSSQDNPESAYQIIFVETDDIPHYQNKQWHQEMRETLGERRYKIEVLGEEVYEADNALIPGYILEEIEIINPIRTDFLYPQDVDEEGYYKDMNIFAEIKEGFDPGFGYAKGLWIWKDPIPGKEYIFVADVAGGVGKDFSCILGFDPETNDQILEFKAKVSTEVLKQILELIIQYYNDAKLSIERNGLGISICEYFGETENYEGFYWHKKARNSIVPGFPMVNPIRSHAIAHMETAITRQEYGIKSVRIINELRNFGLSKRGKLEAISGNDDLVMCLAQFAYLQQIGWAVTQNMMANHLLYGDIIDEENERQMQRRLPRYYDDDFDKPDVDKEAEMYAKALGLTMIKTKEQQEKEWLEKQKGNEFNF